ncbi:alpha/beta hydrolase [Alteromonas gracilis]|uniref:alpha/beta hydrolase n=1 Tax=Alteromonas gracilis TaxID=1479524 RepID=UPI003735F34A
MKFLITIAVSLFTTLNAFGTEYVLDEARSRSIPIDISHPTHSERCTLKARCSVAFISAGYGVPHDKYEFLVDTFNKLGFLSVAIAHELPQDPELSREGNLYETRSENWIRGAATLDFLLHNLKGKFTEYDFDSIVLVGHSNGGDISSWLANENPSFIASVITLDNRRVPLPRNENIKVFSIRGSDFPADRGVLPSEREVSEYDICVVKIPQSKHNDMSDFGPHWLKKKISKLVERYIKDAACASLKHDA